MIGRLTKIQRLFGGEWEITFSTKENFSERFEELKESPVNVEIKKATGKRSRDANALAWVLMDKLAEKTRIPKTEIYRNAIKEIGGVSETVCVQDKAVERLCSGWQKNGIGWQTDTMPSKIPGCTNVILYYGSSTYDTAQMSRLVDLIIQECEQQGIPTLRDEAEQLLGKWANEKHPAK
jgi:hypothetical protein